MQDANSHPFTLDPSRWNDSRALGARHREIESERRRLRIARREVDAAIVERLAEHLVDSLEAATTFAKTILELGRQVARRRIRAASAVRCNPLLLHHLRSGGMSLTALSILGIHAGVTVLAEAAVGRSCAEVQDLVDAHCQSCTCAPTGTKTIDGAASGARPETVGRSPLEPESERAASDATLECELIEFAVDGLPATSSPGGLSHKASYPSFEAMPSQSERRSRVIQKGHPAPDQSEPDLASTILEGVSVRESEPGVMRMIRVESMLFWLPVNSGSRSTNRFG